MNMSYAEFKKEMEEAGMKSEGYILHENDSRVTLIHDDTVIHVACDPGDMFTIRGNELCKSDEIYAPHRMYLSMINYEGNSPDPDDILEIRIIPADKVNQSQTIFSVRCPYKCISSDTGLSINESIFLSKDKCIEIRILKVIKGTEYTTRIASFNIDISCDMWLVHDEKDMHDEEGMTL